MSYSLLALQNRKNNNSLTDYSSINTFIASPIINNNSIISPTIATSSISLPYKQQAMSSVSSISVENNGSIMVAASVSPYPLTTVGMMATVNSLNANENNLNCVIRPGKIAKFGFYLLQIFIFKNIIIYKKAN